MCRRPTAAAVSRPWTRRQSPTSTPRSPSKEFDGGVDVLDRAMVVPEHGSEGGRALADACAASTSVPSRTTCEIGVVFDGTPHRIDQASTPASHHRRRPWTLVRQRVDLRRGVRREERNHQSNQARGCPAEASACHGDDPVFVLRFIPASAKF